ncbi:MAG TPA: hypothetical protein VGI80_05210 [Pyrinomonadaceae bacterium]
MCISCLFVGAFPVHANETDQYNLPPKPLADIAPEVEAYVVQKIQTAIDKLNEQILAHERCLRPLPSAAFGRRAGSTEIVEAPPRKPAGCGGVEQEQAKLITLRSPDAVARAVYDQLGAGNIFISDTGKWLNTHKFEHEPSRYTTSYGDSIYVSAPVDYATISPTIRVYGVEFGTDKFDHLFQQGYTYYRKYNAAKKAGKTDAEALKTVVAYGRFTENTFFGYTVSGVYSNADLAANIAGLKFYQNLANEVVLGTTTRPAIFRWADDHWQFSNWTGMCSETFLDECFRGGTTSMTIIPEMVRSLLLSKGEPIASPTGTQAPSPATPDASSGGTASTPKTPESQTQILRPFISDHLNEALNPSNYLFFLYPVVRSVVQKRACPEWRAAYPNATRDEFTTRTAALTTWNGLDYGYKQTSRQVRLANTCFPDPKGPVPKE